MPTRCNATFLPLLNEVQTELAHGRDTGAARNVVGILRGLISSDVKLSDCRFAFKQLLGREGEPLGSPLVSFLRGLRYLSTPFLSVSITRRDRSVDR
jgi:hypothetical protein